MSLLIFEYTFAHNMLTASWQPEEMNNQTSKGSEERQSNRPGLLIFKRRSWVKAADFRGHGRI